MAFIDTIYVGEDPMPSYGLGPAYQGLFGAQDFIDVGALNAIVLTNSNIVTVTLTGQDPMPSYGFGPDYQGLFGAQDFVELTAINSIVLPLTINTATTTTRYSLG